MQVLVLRERWRAHPLTWIHRGEATSLAAELAAAGHELEIATFDPAQLNALPAAIVLLRVSDPLMPRATEALAAAGRAFRGPSPASLARCYDKHAAYVAASEAGIDCPRTWLAADPPEARAPLLVKPRRGSDSIGLRLLAADAVPARLRDRDHLVQTRVRGREMTVAVIDDRIGWPLALDLPPDEPYTFARKYLWRPKRAPLTDHALADRVRAFALRVAQALRPEWAARVDLIQEEATGRLMLLECDVAPIVASGSAFSESLAAAGMTRTEQLARLMGAAY